MAIVLDSSTLFVFLAVPTICAIKLAGITSLLLLHEWARFVLENSKRAMQYGAREDMSLLVLAQYQPRDLARLNCTHGLFYEHICSYACVCNCKIAISSFNVQLSVIVDSDGFPFVIS